MEVMVATVLISAMLISLLSFVQVAADNWRRADQSINLTAELNTIDQHFINQAIEAFDITYPPVGVTSYTLKLKRQIASGTFGTSDYRSAWIEMRHTLSPGTRILSAKLGSSWATAPVTVSVTDIGPNNINSTRYMASLSSHLAVASFTRTATNSVRLFVRLEAPVYQDTNATPTLEATMTYYFPNLQ